MLLSLLPKSLFAGLGALSPISKSAIKATICAGLFSGGLVFAAAAPANAATIVCPPTPLASERVFSATFTGAGGSCLTYDSGNINGNGDAVNALGYITIDKSDDNDNDALDGALTISAATDGLSGSFSFVAPGFTEFVLGLKSGSGGANPDWAAFLLPAGVTGGTWIISGNNPRALSHAILYGKVAVAPIPAALPMLGAGLGILGFVGWRRKNRAAA